MICHSALTELAKLKMPSVGQDADNENSHKPLIGMWTGITTLKSHFSVFSKAEYISYDLTVPLLCIRI